MENVISTQNYTIGKDVRLSSVVGDLKLSVYGFDFKHWYESQTDKTYDDAQIVNFNYDKVFLSAIWDKHKYKVRFLEHDRTTFKSEDVEYLDYAENPGNPIKSKGDNYYFAGWNPAVESKQISQDFDFNPVFQPYTKTITENASLTAYFTNQQYTVSAYSSNESFGTATVNGKPYDVVKSGSQAIWVAEPKNGYEFSKWSNGSTEQKYSQQMTQNLSLTAYFSSEYENKLVFETVNSEKPCLFEANDPQILSVLRFSVNGQVAAPYNLCSEIEDVSSIVRVADYTNSMIEIADNSFNGCGNLTTCHCGTSISSIGLSAFYGCQSLVSCYLPNVKRIRTHAFKRCNISNFQANSLEVLEQAALDGNTKLVKATLGKISIIESSTFFNCFALTTVICNWVVRIKPYAFFMCNSLTDIYMRYHTLIVTLEDVNAFGTTASKIKIHVHSTLIEEYKKADNWKTLYQNGIVDFVSE